MASNGAPTLFKALVPRFRWPTAGDRLRTVKVPFTAEALNDLRAVLVKRRRRGAAAIKGIGTSTSKLLPEPRPEPPLYSTASDPLEQAFARARADALADQEAA